jgi:hypothetical protein
MNQIMIMMMIAMINLKKKSNIIKFRLISTKDKKSVE